jgi:hypothetical protein
MVAAALIDRLVHHADIITLKGKSYRLKERGTARARACADGPGAYAARSSQLALAPSVSLSCTQRIGSSHRWCAIGAQVMSCTVPGGQVAAFPCAASAAWPIAI